MSDNRLTMKMLPFSERPYEKFERFGAGALTDAELLAIIIKSGTKEETALQLAQKVLVECESKKTFSFEQVSLNRLKEIKGIGRVKAIQLKAVFELSKRFNSISDEIIHINNPRQAYDFLMRELKYEKQEHIKVLMLDVKSKLIKAETVAIGSISEVGITPREVFKKPVEYSAANIILAHNHPSGDATPSEADIEFTGKVAFVGKVLGISVVDHIVVTDDNWCSMRKEGLFPEEL